MDGSPSPLFVSFRARSAAGLTSLGEAMAKALIEISALQDELLVGFDGELGTGKTTLVAGALRALGVHGPVTSPTYGLVHPYAVHPAGLGRELEILHVDLYRLRHAPELEELGLRDDLRGPEARPLRVLLVEWFANARGGLGGPDVSVALRHSNQARAVGIQGLTPSGRELVQRLHTAGHRDLVLPREEVYS